MLGILLDLLNLSVYLPFLKADEDDIVRNIKHLKKQEWFHKYLNEQTYKQLIIENTRVRQTIGKFKTSKLNQSSYNIKCEKRLHKVLNKELA